MVSLIYTIFFFNFFNLYFFQSLFLFINLFTTLFIFLAYCCVVAVTQINYPNLNEQDNTEQVRGRFHEKDLVKIFILDNM
jgi:hypothetical protein